MYVTKFYFSFLMFIDIDKERPKAQSLSRIREKIIM